MLKSYFRVAVREVLRHKVYSLINILGLALGMACSILILLYVQDELSFDRMHENAERTYRLTPQIAYPGRASTQTALTSLPMAPTLHAEVPEVEDYCRLAAYFEAALPGKAAVSFGENQFNEAFFWADPSFFRFFSFRMLEGSPETALTEPSSVVVTERTAAKFFGGKSAFGRLLRIDSGFSAEEYKVTGVIEDLPKSSHLQLDIVASIASLENVQDERMGLDNWNALDSYSYVMLPAGADLAAVEAKFHQTIEKHMGERLASIITLKVQPLTGIHLHSHLLNEMSVNSDITHVYGFSLIAFLIVIIACINYMNLATARSANRAKEVGLRKVVGANRFRLVRQFLGESFVVALVALAVAVALVKIVLPAFNAFTGKEMSFGATPLHVLALLGVAVFVGLTAGSYPAFFLSSFQPLKVLQGTLAQGTGGSRFRTVLVVLQFVLSVALIICTRVVLDQTEYMRNFRLGFDQDRILVLPVRDVTLRDRFETVKDELAKVENVEGTSISALLLGREAPEVSVAFEGFDERVTIGSMVVDYDFLDLFGHELVAGRDFSRERESDYKDAFIANEATLRLLGLTPEEALDRKLNWGGSKDGTVVGIVRDFNYQPLKFPVKPLLLHMRPIAYHYLWVRLGPGDIGATLDRVRSVWKRISPHQSFNYAFLDEELDRLYRADERLGQMFGAFAAIAILVASLGLLGLISFTAEQRTREIGLRKVVGASVRDIVTLLVGQFTRVVVVAVLIAWPIAWLTMETWLRDFAYRIRLGVGVFLLSGVLALLIAWLTVGFQATKAALIEPMKALRYE